MGRPKKMTVDYFSHDCIHSGKTLFILESKYKNDGYAFWFKLLELLGSTEGHFYDCRNPDNMEFLQAKTNLSEDVCIEILNLLAKLDAIDKQLWEKQIVWCDNFLIRIVDVYKNRRVELPIKPSFYEQKTSGDNISTDINPQSKVKESKVKESKVKESKDNTVVLFDKFWDKYPRKVNKKKAKDKFLSKGFNITEDKFEKIMNGLDVAINSEQWQKDNGNFIPHPITWLNGERWEDETMQSQSPFTRSGGIKGKPGKYDNIGRKFDEI